MENYKEIIKLLRKTMGWSRVDLGVRVGVSDRTVEGWEQGKRPSQSALIILERLVTQSRKVNDH